MAPLPALVWALWCSELLGTGFSSGTLVVNLVGCLAIGVVVCSLGGLDPQARDLWRLALVVGFLGSFTTLSTFSYEQILLLGEGRYIAWLLYAAGNVLGGLMMVLAGIGIGKMVW